MQDRLDAAGNCQGYPLLQFKPIFDQTIEAITPAQKSGDCPYEASGNAHPLATAADRSLHEIPNFCVAAATYSALGKQSPASARRSTDRAKTDLARQNPNMSRVGSASCAPEASNLPCYVSWLIGRAIARKT